MEIYFNIIVLSISFSSNANVLIQLDRNFMKKDRNLKITYQPIISSNTNTLDLKNEFLYFQNQAPDSTVVQQRTTENSRMDHNATAVYTEPFGKKFKAEFTYNYTLNKTNNNRTTFNLSSTGYDDFNPLLSNNFDNTRLINRAGTRLIYDVKKYRISVGSFFRNIQQENINLTTSKVLNQTYDNILPEASFQYRISRGSNLSLDYRSSSQQPDIKEMQPVPDNTDPNRITIGNPDLKPTFSNRVSLNYYFFKGVSDINFWSGANYGNTSNQISYSTYYDAQGRAITQPLNVDGNYYANLWLGGGFPVFKRFFKINYNFSSSLNNNVSYVNTQKNNSQTLSFNPGLNFEKDAEKFEVRLGGHYSYNVPKSSISVQSNQPYYTYGLEGNVELKLPKKFFVNTDGNYTNNGNRSPGYNLNYFIWNASVGKSFFKTENLVVSLNGYDLLNQNISNRRTISSNQISDVKTQIIKRYFLVRILYKFNSQKTKSEEEDDDE